MPKTETAKTLVEQAVSQLRAASIALATLRLEMQRLAESLPEYPVVMQMFGVGPALGPQLMAEIGDVSRFHSKKALVAYAGIDASPYQSGSVDVRSRSISKRGSASLRRTLFLVMSVILQNSPAGDILCDETLPEGTEIVCYWAPDAEYTKYWAIRQGDNLLRFCEEESGYRENYRVEPFYDVLGYDGFRILCPRGASYYAYDYYYLDEGGVPCLLAGCSGKVLEQDADKDGQRELLWLSSGAVPYAYYVFQRENVTYQVDISQWLIDSLGEAWLPLPVWDQWVEGTYAISILNWKEDDPSPATEGYVMFTEENVQFFLPEL